MRKTNKDYRLITSITPRVRISNVFSCSSSPSIFHESNLKRVLAFVLSSLDADTVVLSSAFVRFTSDSLSRKDK